MPAKTHGESYTPEYRTWIAMRRRCENQNGTSFHNYGGRGIRVCERWSSYTAFLADMGRKPSPKHTIERRDNERGYEPDNCFWATRTRQIRNRRNTFSVEVDGQSVAVADLAEQHGLRLSTLRHRLERGWPLSRALIPEKMRAKRLTVAQVKDIRESVARGTPRRVLAERYGVTYATIGHVVRGDTWKSNAA